jgi:ribose 5-phosphate isomerase B
MRIALASDHAGFEAKERLRAHLAALGHEVRDFGCAFSEPCDYPDFVVPAARAVARGECERGFVLGGSGNGEQMAANKVRGVRAALVHDAFTAEMARRHNDANVASFGARVTPIEEILGLAEIFLSTPFDGGRHERRIQKIAEVEKEEASKAGN